MYNTIILLKGEIVLSGYDYIRNFEKGDTIYGVDSCPKEVKIWNIEQKDEASLELSKYRCSYCSYGNNLFVEEYALEYCECDEFGEFIQGSDYYFAQERK